MDTDLTPLGELLEAVRQAKRPRLSQNAVAKAAGTSSTTYRRIISGVSRFGGQDVPFGGSADTVAQIARALGVTPEQLEEAGRADAADELRALLASDAPDAADLVARVAELRAEADRLEREADLLDAAGDTTTEPDLEYAHRLLAQAHEILARRHRDA
jgi:hypothetical protein